MAFGVFVTFASCQATKQSGLPSWTEETDVLDEDQLSFGGERVELVFDANSEQSMAATALRVARRSTDTTVGEALSDERLELL